jgi:hypothetical protein
MRAATVANRDGRRRPDAVFPVAVTGKLSDLSPMKVFRHHGLILPILISLGLMAALAMDIPMAVLDQSMPAKSVSAPEPSCECCPDCDGLAALDACSLFCVNHPGSMEVSATILDFDAGHAVPRWTNNWTHRTFPPDLHPPRALRSF